MCDVRSGDRGPALRWLGVLVATLAAVLLPAVGDAGVLCGKRSATTGQLREGSDVHVRTTCKATELQLTLADLGLQPTFTVRTGNQITTNGSLSSPALCQPGEIATGGGAVVSGSNGGAAVLRSSQPQPNTAGSVPTSWRVTAANVAGTGTITSTTYVVCQAP